jgi:hypothetical protein
MFRDVSRSYGNIKWRAYNIGVILEWRKDSSRTLFIDKSAVKNRSCAKVPGTVL